MANAQPDPSSQLTYLEHFGLDRSPFARLPGPSAIYAADQYSVLMAHLVDAQAETDCLLVLRGVDGSGKTTLLNRFLSSLEEDASFASIDEQCKSAEAFHLSLLQQIGFSNLEGRLGELQNITREFLVHRAAAGDHLLLVIDNAHQIHPAVFEQLFWLAAIQHEERRVLSVILAGNSELDHVLESPAMAKLEFRNAIGCQN